MPNIADLLDAAASLHEAGRSQVPCRPIRDKVPDATIDDAYVIQQVVAAVDDRPDRRLVGRKIGLTSRSVQVQMGVDEPDFGLLFTDTALGDGDPVPLDRLIQPRIEGEVAFVLGEDLLKAPVTVADVITATQYVVAAIEIVDSRIENWDISIVDTVADNASSGLFVLGAWPRELASIPDLRSCSMSLTGNGEEVSAGSGADCLGHPVNAVVWLANTVAERGAPLRAGEVILSGALGPLVPAERGQLYELEIEGLGSVRADFRG